MGILDNPNPPGPQSAFLRSLLRLAILTFVLFLIGWGGKVLFIYIAAPAIFFLVLTVLLCLIFLFLVCQTFGIVI